jgi:hypothetical protein
MATTTMSRILTDALSNSFAFIGYTNKRPSHIAALNIKQKRAVRGIRRLVRACSKRLSALPEFPFPKPRLFR